MHKNIEQYKQYLGPRYRTFLYAFETFIAIGGKTVVELGTSRSFVSGGIEGCMINNPKYWDPTNPSKWDWGAGIFTRMCAMHLQEYQPEIHTVDIDADAIEISQVISAEYRRFITYHLMSSEDFLSSFSGKIDFLYMDSGETDEEADKLHLREAQMAISRGLFSDKAIVLIDDVTIPGETKSKGTYSISFLRECGFDLRILDYQAVLQKPAD